MPIARLAVKRGSDLAVSLVSLAFLATPFLIVALAVKLDSKGPIFFRQERVGKGGEPFRIWKFRTMVEGADRQGPAYDVVARRDSRVTRVGRFLRNSGIDELPQLLNVFWGTMSLVGPRPTIAYEVAHYDRIQRRKLLMKPGLTSLAIVSGRNALPLHERIRLDVLYVNHWSLWLDLKILLKTLWVVLVTRKGVYEDEDVRSFFEEPPVDTQDDGRS